MKTLTRLIASLSLALLVPLLHMPAANAAKYQVSTGHLGAVSLNGPMLNGYDHQTRLG